MTNEPKTMLCDIEAGPFSKVTPGQQVWDRLGIPEDLGFPKDQMGLLSIIYWQQEIINDLENRVRNIEGKIILK